MTGADVAPAQPAATGLTPEALEALVTARRRESEGPEPGLAGLTGGHRSDR